MSAKLPGAKRQEISYVVNGKSDIIVSFDARYLAPVISQKKPYEFRSWRADPEVKRMWLYVNRSVQSLMYILELDSPVEYPKQIPNDNFYIEKINRSRFYLTLCYFFSFFFLGGKDNMFAGY